MGERMTMNSAQEAADPSAGACTTIGIDVGGTHIDAAVVDGSGRILQQLECPTRRGSQAVVADIVELCDALIDSPSSAGRPKAIGIGIPGTVEPGSGTVRHALNVGIEELDIRGSVEQRISLPVSLSNDVNAAALAADHTITGGHGITVFLNYGTGLAAGIVIDGRLLTGVSGGIGEIGHIPMDPQGLPCGCGQRGCLETVASGGGIARQWPTTAPYPAQDMLDHAAMGDERAAVIRQRLFTGMARSIQLVTQTFDPNVIALGGGMLKLGEPLLVGIHHEIESIEGRSTFVASLHMWDRVRPLGDIDHLGSLGAALVARSQRVSISPIPA